MNAALTTDVAPGDATKAVAATAEDVGESDSLRPGQCDAETDVADDPGLEPGEVSTPQDGESPGIERPECCEHGEAERAGDATPEDDEGDAGSGIAWFGPKGERAWRGLATRSLSVAGEAAASVMPAAVRHQTSGSASSS